MSDVQQGRLYPLLPAIYRQRDAAQGEPLRALLAVIEQELQTIEADIDGLYENWFIETCEEWVVPYIGDLLGVRGLSSETRQIFSQRSYVANVINDRRRKGVRAVLARVAQSVTGWSIHVVEYFRLLGLTQHLYQLRPGQGATIDLRDHSAMAWLDTPFDPTARQIDVRGIASHATFLSGKQASAGPHNIANLGLFVWRVQSFPVLSAVAQQISNGCYTFSPLGIDQPLFTGPQTELGSDALNLPLPLSRQALAADIWLARDKPAQSQYYGPQRSLHIVVDGQPLALGELVSRDLSVWPGAPETAAAVADGQATSAVPLPRVAIDVVLGRLAFLTKQTPKQTVLVRYHYGFTANIGAGPYDRRQTLAGLQSATWQINVQAGLTPASPQTVTTLEAALAAWAQHGAGQTQPHGIITILDDGVYAATLAVSVPDKGSLVIQAADGKRPALRTIASLEVTSPGVDAMLTLNGLLLQTAGVHLSGSGQVKLVIRNCTAIPLTPGAALPGVSAADSVKPAPIVITHSLLGALRLPDSLTGLTVQDSVIDGGATDAIAGALASAPGAAETSPEHLPGYGPAVMLERVTVFGRAKVRELTATEVIFTQPVIVQRTQSGMVRFSYVPNGSQTPRRYRCQPEPASTAALAQVAVLGQPSFTSTDYRDPGYAQLGPDCPPEISAGAENGAEMGVFQHLLQPQRAANLRSVLAEYLPAGLEAGIFYVT